MIMRSMIQWIRANIVCAYVRMYLDPNRRTSLYLFVALVTRLEEEDVAFLSTLFKTLLSPDLYH